MRKPKVQHCVNIFDCFYFILIDEKVLQIAFRKSYLINDTAINNLFLYGLP